MGGKWPPGSFILAYADKLHPTQQASSRKLFLDYLKRSQSPEYLWLVSMLLEKPLVRVDSEHIDAMRQHTSTAVLYKLKLGDVVTTIPTIGKQIALCFVSCHRSRQVPRQASTSKLCNIRISASQFGMSVARTKSDHCGGIITRIVRV